MPNNGYSQQALAADAQFRQRLKSGLAAVAWEVQNEAESVPNHVNRLAYARLVMRQLENEAVVVAPTFVMRPNIINFETSYDFAAGHVVTTSGDADILSQLVTDWDEMAAAAGFNVAPLSPPV